MIARRVLGQAEEIVSCIALIIVVLAVCWGVITRYVLAQPAVWAGEVAAFGFAWCVFIGAAAVVKRGGHVSIDMFVAFLPARLRDLINLGAQLTGIGFCLAAAFLGFNFALTNADNPSAVLRLPLSVLYLAPAIGFTLMALRGVQAMVTR